MVVVRIKHFYDISCHIGGFHRLLIISLIKLIEAKGFLCLGIPYAKSVYDMIVVPDYRSIIGNSLYRLIALMYEAKSSVRLLYGFYPSAKAHFLGKLRSTDFKGISVL